MNTVFGPSPERVSTSLGGHRRLLVALFIGACLVTGAALRFHNIGKFGFWTDEYFHVFAAQSLLADGSLAVPLHGEYTRSKLITYMTAASFKIFGVSETSARAPFAAVNVLFLGVAFLFIRRLYGLLPALASLAVLSLAPFMIEMSRECRMYPVFQLAYFTMGALFLLGFEPFVPRPGWEGRLGIDARFLAGAIAVFPIALHVHDLTMNFGLVVIGYCATLFVWEILTRGWRAAVFSRYGFAVGVAALGTVGGIAVAKDEIFRLAQAARDVPDWATAGLGNVNFYRYMFSDGYPVLFFAYPLGCFVFMKEHGRRGFFAVVSFTLLFVLHSYVFGRKGDRYIFYVFPYFVLVSSSLAASVAAALHQSMRQALAETPRWLRAAGWFAAIPATYIFFYPWLSTAMRTPNTWAELDWKANVAELKEEAGEAEILHTSPMPHIYYFGETPDFYMLGEVWKRTDHQGRIVRSAADLKAFLDRPGEAVVVTDQGRLGNAAFITKDMEDMINARMQLEKSKVDRRIRYYREITASNPPRNLATFSAPKKARP